MDKPKNFDNSYEIIFKTEFGKGEMYFQLQEFLGQYYYPPHTDDCYKEMLFELFNAVKNGKVQKPEAIGGLND